MTIEELKTLIYRDRCIFLNTKQPCLSDKIGTNGCKECSDKIIDELVEKIRSEERRKILDKVSEKLKAEMLETYPKNINGVKAPTPFTHFTYKEMCGILDDVITEIKENKNDKSNIV